MAHIDRHGHTVFEPGEIVLYRAFAAITKRVALEAHAHDCAAVRGKAVGPRPHLSDADALDQARRAVAALESPQPQHGAA